MNEKEVHDDGAPRQLLEKIDASYPRGWYVAVGDNDIIAASANFHELEETLVAQGRDPSETLVVEAGTTRPEYLTIFFRRIVT